MIEPEAPGSDCSAFPADAFGMTDFAVALRGDGGAVALQGAIDRLDGVLARVRMELDRGVPPSRFEATRRVFTGAAAARDVIGRLSLGGIQAEGKRI